MSVKFAVYFAAVGLGIALLVRWLAKSAERPGSDGDMFSPGTPSGSVPPADSPGDGHM